MTVKKCEGWPDLFLATDAATHRYAAAICATCPALSWCRNEAKKAQQAFPGGLEGTWAGDLYVNGRVVSGKASFGDCPTCGAVDGKPCTSRFGNVLGQPHLARYKADPRCRICGTTFKATRRRYNHCSDACSREANRRRHRRHDAKRGGSGSNRSAA